ncbi:hydrolase 2, exosortase A system-associated [Niveibacterium sp. SC-1]|uniref:hydrolase 2, exosortase A system-associated n=1 Tax=Niveibacterium sp. SC-1 TaxID=3135646 RepID=UPI00311FB1B9
MIQGFFLPASIGGRYCVLHRPAMASGRGVVVIPPFAEEANKSRSNLAAVARALAAEGAHVLFVDLFGTGDSAGDFGDADWSAWTDDVRLAAAHLRALGCARITLLGLRTGCLLAAAALGAGVEADDLVLLAPQSSGRQVLTQFLRLGAASELGADAAARIDTRARRAELAAGRSIEIAGYTLSPALADGLEAASLELPQAFRGPLAWLEVSSAADAALSPAARIAIEKLQAHGLAVDAQCVPGPAFWQTQEIEFVAGLPQTCVRAWVGLAEKAGA